MSTYVNIMAKVSPETAARLDRIVEREGFRSKYELLQAAVSLVLKWADPGGEEMNADSQETAEKLKQLFGSMAEVRHCMARIKPNGGRKVDPSEIIAFYGREALMLKVRDADGSTFTTTNVRDIFEVVLRRTLPAESLTQLKELQRVRNLPTLLSILMDVVAGAKVEDVEVNDMFSTFSDADPRRVELGLEHKPSRSKNKRHNDDTEVVRKK